MKKVLLCLVLLSGFCFASENIITPDDKGIVFEAAPSEEQLINVDGIKRVNTAEKAKRNFLKRREKVQLDEKQLELQRALDYTTKNTNSLLPLF